jgi:hypothetical protein
MVVHAHPPRRDRHLRLTLHLNVEIQMPSLSFAVFPASHLREDAVQRKGRLPGVDLCPEDAVDSGPGAAPLRAVQKSAVAQAGLGPSRRSQQV